MFHLQLWLFRYACLLRVYNLQHGSNAKGLVHSSRVKHCWRMCCGQDAQEIRLVDGNHLSRCYPRPQAASNIHEKNYIPSNSKSYEGSKSYEDPSQGDEGNEVKHTLFPLSQYEQCRPCFVIESPCLSKLVLTQCCTCCSLFGKIRMCDVIAYVWHRMCALDLT